MRSRFLFLAFFLSAFFCVHLRPISAQTSAPGGPGKDAQWATAGKQGVGTANSPNSKVWFTLAQGVMTEVYYPDVTTANVHLLQFIVVDPKTKRVETEQDDAFHQVRDYFSSYYKSQLEDIGKEKKRFGSPRTNVNPDDMASLRFTQINRAKTGQWTISKEYVTDPNSNTVLINVQFDTDNKDLELYIYFDPSLGNTGLHDTAWNEGPSLLASDGKYCSALLTNQALTEISNGYYQISDGVDELKKFGKIVDQYSKAPNGNVVQIAKIGSRGRNQGLFTIALGFGETPSDAVESSRISLKRGFVDPFNHYVKGWSDYVKTLPKVDSKYQAQFNMAAMVLKAHEDKSHPGANVASLSIPWGGGANANENNVGGYHLVWSRDLYQVATAYMALGDTAAANRALDFVFNVQQKPDGSFPQNSFLDGKPFWGSLQMDEVAYPLILAYQLGRTDKATFENHVKKAADFIVRNGPSTPQERWEERPGYSPSTIAAEIAGLVCAADIAKKNGDGASALIWLAAADDWARNVERWTATTNGKYGDGNYYLRITAHGNPDAGEKVELNNGAGTFDERDIVDAGFLELVRLGIKPADDPLIVKSLKVIDQVIKVDTPNGPAFYRYNHDGYGEMPDGRRWNWDGKYTGQGRPWPLLSGERGQYELAVAEQCDPGPAARTNYGKGAPVFTMQQSKCLSVHVPALKAAVSRLDNMLGFANEGLMIPEQVWDKKETPAKIDKQFIPDLKFGEGTGSATPLAWSMAQFIRLALNLEALRNFDTPQVVYDRYKNGVPGQVSDAGGTEETFVLPPLKPGEAIKFPRNLQPNTTVAYEINGEQRVTTADEKGKVTLEFKMPDADSVGILGIRTPDGATAFERVALLLKPKQQQFSPALIEKIKTAKTSPVIEDGKAVIFFRGAADQISVAGDMTSWNPGRILMQRIGDDLQAVQIDVGQSARVEYKFVVDGKWVLDPLNSDKLDNGVGGENSFFAMPGYKATAWDHAPTDIGPALDTFEIASKALGDTRKVQVYAPAIERTANVHLPVLYLEDGSDYVRRAKAVETETNLVNAGKVKPFIMVFLDPKDRNKEYWASDKWADFVANEVVPEIDKRYHTIATRDGRATLGASLGGITSLWIGLKYPDKFARLGGQSSSFWVDNERVVKALEKLDPATTKFRFYLDDGMLEGTADTRRVNVMLRSKGYDVTYVEGQTGHNWTAWHDRLADAFIALWR